MMNDEYKKKLTLESKSRMLVWPQSYYKLKDYLVFKIDSKIYQNVLIFYKIGIVQVSICALSLFFYKVLSLLMRYF